eukprot:2108157-Pyramimonas_sp.AAC.2
MAGIPNPARDQPSKPNSNLCFKPQRETSLPPKEYSHAPRETANHALLKPLRSTPRSFASQPMATGFAQTPFEPYGGHTSAEPSPRSPRSPMVAD